MKHILNVLKNEIFFQTKQIDDLVKNVTISQESYLKDRNNEELFNSWSNNVNALQKTEANLKSLRSAYVILCKACDVEAMTNEEIIAEKTAKKAKKVQKEKMAKKGDEK